MQNRHKSGPFLLEKRPVTNCESGNVSPRWTVLLKASKKGASLLRVTWKGFFEWGGVIKKERQKNVLTKQCLMNNQHKTHKPDRGEIKPKGCDLYSEPKFFLPSLL